MEKTFFELPGIKAEIDNFKKILNMPEGGHILIRGPIGIGKGLFLQIFKETCPAPSISHNCIASPPGQLPATIKQAVQDGVPIIIEDLDHLAEEDRRSLFGALQSTRVIASSSNTDDKIPTYLMEEFKTVVNIPPLHQRRMDIFHFIARKYPQLRLYPSGLLTLFSYHWPGNLRQLDRTLFNIQNGDDLEPIIGWQDWMNIATALEDAGLTSDKLELINNVCFGGIMPFDYPQIFFKRFCTVSFDDDGFPLITCVNEKTKSSITVDCTAIKFFFSDVFGREALSRNIPIFHNDIFQEHTGFDEVPPVSESDAYAISDTASPEIISFPGSERTRQELLWEFTLACNKAHVSLSEVRQENSLLPGNDTEAFAVAPALPSMDSRDVTQDKTPIYTWPLIEKKTGLSRNMVRERAITLGIEIKKGPGGKVSITEFEAYRIQKMREKYSRT